MKEFLSKLEEMDTKTDPRFAVRANASIDLQLRATTDLKRKSKKTTSESAMAKQSTKGKKEADNTLSLFCLCKAAAAGHQRTDSAIPAGHQRRIPPLQPVIRSPENGLFNFHPVTRERILHSIRLLENGFLYFQPVTKERIPPFQPVIRSPENTFCGSRPIIQST
jgi:hypothetical protein